MTQLLISVKNIDEALIALEAGADIVDFKDPNLGALGALDLAISTKIIAALNGQTIISATVGEDHANLNALVLAMQMRAKIGVDIIKIGVSTLFDEANFFAEMRCLSNAGTKIVAVFFADERVDLTLLPMLNQAGFYGAMLDTKNKHKNLTQVQTKNDLQNFTQNCHQHRLQSGLAGSLQPQHIDVLVEYNSTYIGFRGGVCNNFVRESDLSRDKVVEVKKLLHAHNKLNAKPQKTLRMALHS